MGKIDDSARLIIKISVEKMGRRETAKMYGIPFVVIDQYLLGIDQGTLTGREIIRLEMGRVKAEKKGNKDWKAGEMDKYKGGRY